MIDPVQDSSFSAFQTVQQCDDAPERSSSLIIGFSNLPTEIRTQILKLALPHHRVIRVKLDFKLARASIIGPFSRVPTVLHVCRDFRHLALSFLRQGLGGSPGGKSTFYWCPELDRLYFVPSGDWVGIHHQHLQNDDGTPGITAVDDYLNFQHLVPNVQHIALPLDKWIISGFHSRQYSADRWMIKLLRNLSALKSVCFLLEPWQNWLGELHWERNPLLRDGPSTRTCYMGTIVLYEPLDVPIRFFRDLTASSIELEMEACLDTFRKNLASAWSPPAVQILVLGIKRFKNSSFCIPSSRNMEPWVVETLRVGPWGWSGLGGPGNWD